MNDRFGVIFGSVLAVILLLLYAVSAWVMILAILDSCSGAGCVDSVRTRFGEGFSYVLTTVGGLVSALVIARLSIATPGQAPGFRRFDEMSARARLISNWVSGIYLLVWASTGLAALVVGVMLHPGIIPTVSDLGTVWLGLAVAAGYAYFGLTPREGSNSAPLKSTDKTLHSTRTMAPLSSTIASLAAQIANGKIIFDANKPNLRSELLAQNTGQKVTEKLQELVLRLSQISAAPIRVSSLIRAGSKHGLGRAVDIGNEEIAGLLLPEVVPLVGELSIDQVIFDATVAGRPNRNEWNYLGGTPHAYNSDTLDGHRDHIHLAVLS